MSIDGSDAVDSANRVAQAAVNMGNAVQNATTQATNATQNFSRSAQQTGQQIPVYLGATATAAQRAAAGLNAVYLPAIQNAGAAGAGAAQFGNTFAGAMRGALASSLSFVSELAAAQTDKKTAGVFLDTLSDIAYKTTKKNGEFVVPGFEKLVKQKRKARTGINPSTKQKIKVPAQTVLNSMSPR